ncbi:MAG: ribosomal protein S18 acetylase RimI-like enzyme [Gammaproteobacteria bacterium]|jgi:ribosomal protein S18 acetylase RimI-like enzyme
MNIIIRDALERDLDAIADLLGVLFAQEMEFSPNKQKQIAALKTVLSNAHLGFVAVAEHEHSCVGTVMILYSISTALGGRVGILEDMIVGPDIRRAGVGRRLLNYALNRAEKAGCLRVTLLTDSDNERAQRFYQQAGFSQSSMVPFRR